MIEIIAIGVAVLLIAGVLLIDWRQRRREARRIGDTVFLGKALLIAQQGRRRRPKVDRRIQRHRRYGHE